MVETYFQSPDQCPACGDPVTGGEAKVCARCALQDAWSHLGESNAMAAAGLVIDDIPRSGEESATIGKYTLLEPLGGGGMGVVYRAWQSDLKRYVALKTIPGGRNMTLASKQRFYQESEALARMEHPNIVPIYDTGEHEGQPYLVMEYVRGNTLTALAPELLAFPRKSASLVKTTAEAVAWAHKKGVLHRDLKPSNVLMGLDERLRLTDFGLARSLEGAPDLTATGQMLGTPAYASPEQLGADHIPVGVGTDVYGLGALLYHLLTGRPPFVGATTAGVIRQVQEREPLPPQELNPIVPGALEQICLKCLEKHPVNRYATVADLIADLQAFLEDQPIQARSPPLWKRGARIVHRNQGLVALTLVFGLLALGTMSAAIVLALRTYSDTRERAEFDAARETADRWRSYGRTLQGAMEALGRHDSMRARQALETTPAALRGWEYRYLLRRANQSVVVWTNPDPMRTGVSAVAFSPSGATLASGTANGHLVLREFQTGDILGYRRNHRLQVNSVSFSPDGRRILTSGNDGKAAIVDAATLEDLVILEGHVGEVTGAAFLEDDERCVTAGIDGSIRLWNNRGAQLDRWEFGDMGEGILGLEVGPDRRVAAVGTQGMLKIFSAENGKVLSQWQAHRGRAICVTWSASGDRLASSGEEGDVFVWDAGTGKRLQTLPRGPGRTMRLAWSADGHRIAGASYQSEVLVWGSSSGKIEDRCVGHKGIVTAVAFISDGRVVSSGYDRTLRVWALVSSPRGSTLPTEGELRTTCFALGPDGKWIGRGDVIGRVNVEEIPGWQSANSFQAHQESITSMAIAPNGRRMVTAGLDRKVRLWADLDGTLQSELRGDGEIIRCVAISPDGRFLAVGGDDAVSQIWDAESGSLRYTLKNTERFSKRITKVGFSSTSHFLVTVAADNQVGLWDVRTGIWRGHYGNPDALGRATSLAMTRDNQFAAGYANGHAVIWQLLPPNPLGHLAVHQTEVTAVGLSPLEPRLVTGGEDGTLRIWYPQDGSELLRIPVDVEAMKQLEWTPDGHSLVTLATDGTLGYWNGAP